MDELNRILSLEDPAQRAPALTAWFQTAPAEALAASVELTWFDWFNADAIAEGLRARPAEAIPLARAAWDHANPTIRWTALRVLERHPEAAGFLAERIEQAQPPARHHLAAALARAEGREEEYAARQARDHAYAEPSMKRLASSKKGDRHNGLYTVSQIQDPWFTPYLAEALAREADIKLFKGMAEAAANNHCFGAIPALIGRLEGDFLRPALEALSRLGDRSVPAWLLAHPEEKGLAAWQQDCLAPYRRLALPLLIDQLRGLEDWTIHKAALTDLFMVLADDRLVEALFAEAAADAGFAARLLATMPLLYPKCLKKKKGLDLDGLRPFAATLLGGRTLELPGLTSARLAPDGRGLLCVRNRNQVQWVELATGRAETLLSLGAREYLILIGLSADSRRALVVVDQGGQGPRFEIGVWDYGRWDQPVARVRTEIHPQALTTTRDGHWLVIGGDKRLLLVAVDDGTTRELPGHEGSVNYVQAMPDGRLLSGDWSGWLQVWDPATWEVRARIKCDSWARKFARLSADGKLLVYAGHVGIHVWETDTWREIASVTKPLGNNFMSLSPDGRHLLLVLEKKMKFLEFGSWKELLTLDDESGIGMPAFTPDGRTLITLGRHKVRVWHLDELEGRGG